MIFRASVIGGQCSNNPDHFYVFLNAQNKLEAVDKIQNIGHLLWVSQPDYQFSGVLSEDELLISSANSEFEDDHLVRMSRIEEGVVYVTDATLLLVGRDRMRVKVALTKAMEAMGLLS